MRKLRLNRSSQQQAHHQSNSNSYCNESQPRPDHQSKHLSTFCTQGHADSDLMRLSGCRICQHTINAHGDKNQSQAPENCHQQERKARAAYNRWLMRSSSAPGKASPTPASVAHTACRTSFINAVGVCCERTIRTCAPEPVTVYD